MSEPANIHNLQNTEDIGKINKYGMKYRIYIDEVGNPDLESSENPNHILRENISIWVGGD